MTRPRVEFSRPSRETGWLLAAVLLLGAFLAFTDRIGAQSTTVIFDISDVATSVGPDAGVQSFTLADVNDDDRDDLVAINAEAEKVLVYLALEGGMFEESAREFDVLVDGDPEIPTSVAVGDVGSSFLTDDGGEDGNADIVVGTEDGIIAILVGDGGGNFESRDEFIDPATEVVGVALEDFDEDGSLDIAVLDPDDGVYLLLNLDGNFDPDEADLFDVELELPIDVAAGDVNGDDSVDVVVLDREGERLFLLTGDGDGALEEPIEVSSRADPIDEEQFATDLALADLDNDGNDEAIVANSGEFSDLQLLVRNGDRLQDESSFTAPEHMRGLTIARFDANTFPDAILVSENSANSVFLADGGGGDAFLSGGGLLINGIPGSQAVASGDINDDGLVDFVSLTLDGDLFKLAVNQGVGVVTPVSPGATSTPRTTGTPGTPTATRPTNTPTPTATATSIPTVALGRCELNIQRTGGLTSDTRPVAIAQGDLDRDANPDIVVADEANRKLLVFLIDPAAMPLPTDSVNCSTTLTPAVFDLDGTPVAVAVGNLNRREDSFLDVAVLTVSGLEVFFGDGNGGFPQSSTEAVGAEPRSVAINDFDLDGQGDVVVANRASATLRVYFGRGDKTFDTPPLDIAARDAPTVVLAEDLNGDTFPDIAAASDAGRSVLVYFRDAGQPRQFNLPSATPGPTPVAGVPTALTATNFNGDGFTDLAVSVRATSGAGSFVVLTASGVRGNVSFASSEPSATGDRPSSIGTGQFDGGPPLDVVVANFADDDASFFLGTAPTAFMSLDRALVDAGPIALTVADFDADGRQDVIVANQVAGTLTILRSSVPPATPSPLPTGTRTRTGTVTPTQPTATETPQPDGTATTTGTRTATGTQTRTPKQGVFALSEGGCSVAPLDRGGAGAMSLLLPPALILWRRRRARHSRLARLGSAAIVAMTLGGARAHAQPTPQPYVRCDANLSLTPVAMVSADFTSDGRPDIAVLARSTNDVGSLLLVPINAADFSVGLCSRIQPRTTELGEGPAGIVTSDLDRNGRNDLVVAESRGIEVLLGDGQGGFAGQAPIFVGAAARAIVAGDFDRDGFIDLAAGVGEHVQVLFALPRLDEVEFQEPGVTTEVGQSVDALASADFNLDGRLDLAVLSTTSGTVRVLLGDDQVARRFRLLSPFVVGDEPSAIAIGNFDADDGNGVDDIAVTLAGEDAAALFLGTLSGTDVSFDGGTVVSTGDAPSALVAADLNRDGQIDIAVANEGGDSLSLFDGDGRGGLSARGNACRESCDEDCCVGGKPNSVVLARLNDRDAFPDLVVGNEEGPSLTFLLSDDPPTPTATNTNTPSPTPTQTGTTTVTPLHTPTATPTRTDTVTRTPTGTITRTAGPFQLMGESCAITEGGGSRGGVAWVFLALLLIAKRRRRV